MPRLVVTTTVELSVDARLVAVTALQKKLTNTMELALEELKQDGEVDARLELGH